MAWRKKNRTAAPLQIATDLETTRSVMLQIRMTVRDRFTLRIAANTMKQTLSEFVRTCAVESAEAVIMSTGGGTTLNALNEKAEVKTRKNYAPRNPRKR